MAGVTGKFSVRGLGGAPRDIVGRVDARRVPGRTVSGGIDVDFARFIIGPKSDPRDDGFVFVALAAGPSVPS